MAKHRKKQGKREGTTDSAIRHEPLDGGVSETDAVATGVGTEGLEKEEGMFGAEPSSGPVSPCEASSAREDKVTEGPSAEPKAMPRWRRWGPDLIKVAAAAGVIGVAVAIWYQPPLVAAGFPYVSCTFRGQRIENAALYRPLAMPTRYYVALPQKLENRYEWFAVDRRREVVALADEPRHRVMGRRAIRRSDPLGLDLEFRKLDGSEWRISFLDDAIVFSNALLTVRLDTRNGAGGER